MIIVAPAGLILVILLVILFVVVIRNTDRPTASEESEAKNWAIAQAEIREARERYRLDPSEENRRALDEAQRRVEAEEVTANGATSPRAGDPIDQIRRLAELHDQGILSDEEFEKKKASILQRLG